MGLTSFKVMWPRIREPGSGTSHQAAPQPSGLRLISILTPELVLPSPHPSQCLHLGS